MCVCVCVCVCVLACVCVRACVRACFHKHIYTEYPVGWAVEEVWRSGKREIIYPSLHCHHQNDFCIKVGSDDSHFNVS